MIVLGIPTALHTGQVIAGSQTGSGAFLYLVTLYAAELVIALMIVLSVYAIARDRVRLSPATVRALGTAVFVGMFFLLLLVLRGELYAAVPVIVYFIRTRRDLAEELPVWAGGKMTPQRKDRRRDDVVRRPPRSWDGTDSRSAKKPDARRRLKKSRGSAGSKKRRPGASGGRRPGGR